MAALQRTQVLKTLPQGAYGGSTGTPYAGTYSRSPAPAVFLSGDKNYQKYGNPEGGSNLNRHLSDNEMEDNIGGVRVTDNKLRELFQQYDANGNGYLEFDEVKALYNSFENYGIEYTDQEVNQKLRKHIIRDDGKVDYEEFCCIVLSLANR